MRLTILEWSNHNSSYKAITLDVSRERLTMTGRVRSYRDPHKEYDADKSERRRSGGSHLWRADKHRFYVTQSNGKRLRIRYATYRAIDAILSHGHPVACLRMVLASTTLRHASGEYAGPIESRGIVTTPAGYVIVGRPRWVDTLVQSWSDQPDGGTVAGRSTIDRLRDTGTGSMRYTHLDVSVRYTRDSYRYSVALDGVTILTDASQRDAQQWAADHPSFDDPSAGYWSRIEREDAARQFAESVESD